MINQIYTNSNEKNVQSFDAIDFITGTGYKTLYAVGSKADNTLAYELTTQPLDSDHSNYSSVVTDLDITDVASKLEINFDLSVNKTLTVSGNAFINISLGISIGGGGASVSNLRVKYTFYKVATDGSTETAISSQIESNKVSSSSNSVFRLLTKVPITRTVLKKGEKLRLEVQIWGSRSVGTASSGYFYHDGSNRITGTSGGISYGSTLLVQLPIKIEL
jgi:hypothetical protein